jgi:hypothetical protein
LEAVLTKGAGILIELRGTAADVLFLMVTTCVADWVPTFTDPKASEAGERVNAAPEVPVPVSATEVGVLVPLLATTRVPVEDDAAVGLYSTETVQLAPAARLVPQVEADLRKGAETVSEVSVTAPVPVFLTVTTWAAVVVPTFADPKASEVGARDSVSVEAAFPVPVSATELGVLVALLATTSVPVEETAEVGLYWIETVQDEATARLVPQVVADLRNGAETVSEVKVTGAPPLFLTVTTCVLDVAPTSHVPKATVVGDSERV